MNPSNPTGVCPKCGGPPERPARFFTQVCNDKFHSPSSSERCGGSGTVDWAFSVPCPGCPDCLPILTEQEVEDHLADPEVAARLERVEKIRAARQAVPQLDDQAWASALIQSGWHGSDDATRERLMRFLQVYLQSAPCEHPELDHRDGQLVCKRCGNVEPDPFFRNPGGG